MNKLKVNNKRSVITGGAGFIGSHIVEELIKRGDHVIVIDNLSTGRIENLGALINKKRLTFFNGSITDLTLLQKLFSGVNYIFHEAAIPSVPRSIDNPLASHDANITGTLNVLLAARDNGVKKVIVASSSSVYGDTLTLPKNEDLIPNPQSPYAVTKVAAEHYCSVFTRVYGLPTVCLRYFNVYGPRQDPESQYAAVIPRFIKAVSEGRSPVIYGDGEQTRDFTFVKDVVQANMLAADSDVIGVFNIGRGERISLNQLTHYILTLMGRDDIKPIYEKGRLGDVRHSLADITSARAFGYTPRYNIEEGLKETIRRHKNDNRKS